jgi:predicted ATPase/DNA-binding winged helix-turn-helix (wHTH) protein
MSQRKIIGYQFGGFTLRLDQRELRDGDEPMPLPTRAFDMLAYLAAFAGTIVSAEALFRASSDHETAFTPHIVVKAIAAIRNGIGRDKIATASRRGYQLTARVTPLYDKPAATALLHRRLLSMLGRDEDHRIACAALRGGPVTLTGTSGVGKTALATDIGWTFDAEIGRATLVDLSALTDSASVIAVTAAALGVTLRRADAALETIVTSLGAPTLLIFDGCDHVAAGARILIEALLTRVPNLHVLATSQSRLHIVGETVIRIDPLPAEAAANLLVSRVIALDRHFRAEPDDARVASICRHLDGIPAAIEIAAANIPLLGLDGVAQALDRQVDLRHAGSSVSRHSSPRAMAAWTYGQLAETDQQTFRSVTAIPSTFDFAMAAAVIGSDVGDEATVIESLGRLADKSLIMPVAGSTARYRLLEAPRLLGAELRRAAGEDGAVLTRLATYLTDLGNRAEVEWEHAQHEPFLTRYRPEFDNLIPVLDWALAEPSRAPTAIRLAGACGRLFNHYGQFTSGRDYLGRAASLVDDSTLAQDAALVLRRAGSIWHTSDRPLALRYLNRSEVFYRQCDDAIGLARTLSLLGDCLTYLGDHDAAQTALEEARTILEPSSNRSLSTIFIQLGRVAHLTRRFAEAEQLYIHGLELSRRIRDVLRENLILINIAEAKANQGNLRAAIILIEKTVATLRETSYRSELSHSLVNLASYKMLNGEDADAETDEALSLTFEEGGYWFLSELQLCALIGAKEGRLQDAATMTAYVDIGFTRGGDRRQPLELEIRERIAQQIDNVEGDTDLATLWTENDAVEFVRRRLVPQPCALIEAAD